MLLWRTQNEMYRRVRRSKRLERRNTDRYNLRMYLLRQSKLSSAFLRRLTGGNKGMSVFITNDPHCDRCGMPASEHEHLGMLDKPICPPVTARPDEREEEIAELQSAYDYSVEKHRRPD